MSNEQRLPVRGLTTDSKVEAADTAVVITYAAKTGFQHVIDQIIAGYDTSPTGGALTIEDGSGNTIFHVHINDALPARLTFTPPLMGSEGTAMIVTLAAGGGSAIGHLNCRHRVH